MPASSAIPSTWPITGPSLIPIRTPRSWRMSRVSTSHFKGQDLLLQALSGEPWKGCCWLLRFYGAGPDRPYLGRLADYYQISERVEFCGHVRDVRSIWADNHLLVMSSRSEGTPLALVEAMICARPAVVTDVGGHMEWVEEPATGFVAEAASARSLDVALERGWGALTRLGSNGSPGP